jgi:phosphoribosylformimino-5-aminoimidazole carboxamide ribonucleotide (ProFAR) isomerase
MLIIPAIDLKDGKCVRLKQGDMNDATIFSEDPGATARQWLDQGARRLHVVDLNGAAAGKPKNEAAIKTIVAGLAAGADRAGLQAVFDARFRSDEFAEGIAAFLEKRPARF